MSSDRMERKYFNQRLLGYPLMKERKRVDIYSRQNGVCPEMKLEVIRKFKEESI